MSAFHIDRKLFMIKSHRSPRLHPGGIIAILYCDNIYIFNYDKVICQRDYDQMRDDLRRMRFSLHEEAPISISMDTLGGDD